MMFSSDESSHMTSVNDRAVFRAVDVEHDRASFPHAKTR
jgi:hypothetical protein